MKKAEVDSLPPGVYVLHWKPSHGGGLSVAAVGQDEQGNHWFAPTNWVNVPSYDWRKILTVELVTTQDREGAKRR